MHARVTVRWLLLALALGSGCRKDEAPKPSEPAPPPAETPEPEAEPEPDVPPPLHISLRVVDVTTESERPVPLGPKLQAIGEAAAREVGFTLVEDGHDAGLAFHYAVVVDGEPDPKAERGLLTWGVEAGVRVKDGDGLRTTWEGLGRGESPFVRAALPSLEEAFEQVLKQAAASALRDIAMQIAYEKAPAEAAAKALNAEHPEEVWAGLRRLGELGATEHVPRILSLLQRAEPATQIIAAGVLGRLGDERAIEGLARAADGPDATLTVVMSQAIGQIGGAKARKYLSLIKETHPSELVQSAVAEILDNLDDAR